MTRSNGFLIAIVFAVLAIVNLKHAADPPYWDGLTGVYRQGAWLAEHRMDLLSLMQQPRYDAGGPRVHPFYGVAVVFAIAQQIFGAVDTFVLFHVSIWALAALGLVLAYRLLSRETSSFEALVWLLVAATNPIWSAQAAGIYLDLPLASVILIGIYAVWRGHYRAAAMTLGAAYFVKSAALLPAVAAALAALVARRSNHLTTRDALWLCAPAPLMILLNILAATPASPDAFSVARLGDQAMRFVMLAPSLYPALVLQLLLLGGMAVVARRRFSAEALSLPWCFIAFLVLGFWIAYVLSPRNLVRYTVLVHVPMAMLLAVALHSWRRASLALAFFLIGFQGLNQNGAWLRPLPLAVGRSGDRLERSREYLSDLAATRDLCRWLETQPDDQPLLARWPFVQMLTLPRLGYVSQPFAPLVDANDPPLVENRADRHRRLLAAKSRRTRHIFAPSIFEAARPSGPSLAPRAGDRILWSDQRLPAPLVVIEREWTADEWARLTGELR